MCITMCVQHALFARLCVCSSAFYCYRGTQFLYDCLPPRTDPPNPISNLHTPSPDLSCIAAVFEDGSLVLWQHDETKVEGEGQEKKKSGVAMKGWRMLERRKLHTETG